MLRAMESTEKTSAHILVVEDDESISSLLEQVLRLENYSVERAPDGRVALEILKKCETLPDLIILDLTMPIMDGAEFRSHQLKDPKLAPIPVILMTADNQVSTLLKELRITRVLKKPLSIDGLLGNITQILLDKKPFS